ncbi:MAG: hydrogenase nickel incorporation protein HypB [Pseudonocardia sp.]|nr:hydrogenase nickel incorporation protein HypB [Pseudonocardia sp.]
MCATCGCGDGAGVRVTAVGRDGTPVHPHPHPHHHDHDDPDHAHTVVLEQRILAKNDRLAERNRRWLAARGCVVVNLMSAPGSGKTTLLERTIGEAALPLAVIEGDQETLADARRIEATGCPVVQINTGAGCHLDADMTARGLHALDPRPGSVVVVENVGNLVCPALFDLGETRRVVIMSTTEGPDKPLKYPQMFLGADLVLVNKIDLLPHLDLRLEEIVENVRAVNPTADLLPLSAARGEGMTTWYGWLGRLTDATAAHHGDAGGTVRS